MQIQTPNRADLQGRRMQTSSGVQRIRQTLDRHIDIELLINRVPVTVLGPEVHRLIEVIQKVWDVPGGIVPISSSQSPPQLSLSEGLM